MSDVYETTPKKATVNIESIYYILERSKILTNM